MFFPIYLNPTSYLKFSFFIKTVYSCSLIYKHISQKCNKTFFFLAIRLKARENKLQLKSIEQEIEGIKNKTIFADKLVEEGNKLLKV